MRFHRAIDEACALSLSLPKGGSKRELVGRLLRVDLIKPVSNVRPPVRIRPSVRPQKVSFDFNEIWYVGRGPRGRRLTHDSMQYEQIQGHGQGHEPSKVGKSAIFKRYLLPHL